MREENREYIAQARRLYAEIARTGELETRISDGQDIPTDTGEQQQFDREVQTVPPGRLMSEVGLQSITAAGEAHEVGLLKRLQETKTSLMDLGERQLNDMLEGVEDNAISDKDMEELLKEMTVVKANMETVQALVIGLRSA